MRTKTKYLIWEILEAVVIIALIAIRIFSNSEQHQWINLVNYLGLIIAVWTLFYKLADIFQGKPQANFITGLFFMVLAIGLIIGVLIFTGVFIPSIKCNDVFLLLTLLFSLPTQLFETMLIWALK